MLGESGRLWAVKDDGRGVGRPQGLPNSLLYQTPSAFFPSPPFTSRPRASISVRTFRITPPTTTTLLPLILLFLLLLLLNRIYCFPVSEGPLHPPTNPTPHCRHAQEEPEGYGSSRRVHRASSRRGWRQGRSKEASPWKFGCRHSRLQGRGIG